MSASIQELFNISDQLAKNLEIPHKLAVPKMTKIVVNAGIGSIKEDNKAIEKMKKDLSLITGQAPVVRLSKKAIASFKIRKGMPVGLSVTLRKNIMMEFYDRLVNIAMPRIKDFRGYSKKSFDGQGNITIGIKDHIIFPEISVENVENILSLGALRLIPAKDSLQNKLSRMISSLKTNPPPLLVQRTQLQSCWVWPYRHRLYAANYR